MTYRPIASESDLLYLDWVRAQPRHGREARPAGSVGYMHIPDMGGDGIREFIKWFYPQVRKEGHGRGRALATAAATSRRWIIERLRREAARHALRAHSTKTPSTYPDVVFRGPMVCLLNETSASDGDIFPYMFRQAGLGPLIGKRSWGGVVGITGHGPLLDGGRRLRAAVRHQRRRRRAGSSRATASTPTSWSRTTRRSVIAGRDPQLERGVEEVLKQMRRRAGAAAAAARGPGEDEVTRPRAGRPASR